MNKSILIAIALLMLAVHLPAAANIPAKPSDIPLESFSQLPMMAAAQLSPDGTHIAYLRPFKGRVHLTIQDIELEGEATLIAPIDNFDFNWVHWANDDKLVFSMQFHGSRGFSNVAETRLMAVDRDGNNARSIIRNATRVKLGSRVAVDLPPPQVQDDVIDWLPDDPEAILVSIDADHDHRNEVRRINIENGKYTIVMEGLPGIQHWLSDQNGDIRFGWGNQGRKAVALYRIADKTLADGTKTAWWNAGYSPVAFAEERNIAFMIGPGDSGRACIRKVDLRSGEFVGTVFENDSIDVDELLQANGTARPVGFSYTLDLPRHEYFDQQMSVLQRSVDKVLPDGSNQITSMSRDHRQVLVYSTGATNPGTYHHWDRDARSFDVIGESMPNLPVELLSPAKPVSYKARDGMTIPAYLTLPRVHSPTNLPTVILPHGGPEERDDQSFQYLTQFLVSRGYAVMQPNFRGSSGYGSSFSEAGRNQWGGKMQDDVTDSARWLVEQGIADADRLCIVGWSYGGYAAAMAAVKTPKLYQCAASINGILDLARLIADNKELIGGLALTRYMGLKGASDKSVSPFHQAAKISIPMLIVQSTDDERVPRMHGKSMANRLKNLGKNVQYLEVDSGGHSIRDEPSRRQLLSALESFLQQNIGSAYSAAAMQ